MKNEEYDKELLKVSSELMLVPFSQDWGIGNSNFKRLEEFLSYFADEFLTLNSFMKCELVELIIASFNELLIEDSFDQKAGEQFKNFATALADSCSCQETIRYWKNISLYNEVEFPIGKLLE